MTDPRVRAKSDRREGTIVVGADGSGSSRVALRWASEQAVVTGATLRVVTAWHIPSLSYGGLVPIDPDYDFEASARTVQAEELTSVLGSHPAVELSAVVVQGPAGPELTAAADGADLLVVGSRGHGVITGMLLGSVSEYCTTHATCPVVVVPSDPNAAAGADTD